MASTFARGWVQTVQRNDLEQGQYHCAILRPSFHQIFTILFESYLDKIDSSFSFFYHFSHRTYSLHKEGRKRKEEKIKKHFAYNTLELNGTACYFRIIIRNVRGSADNIHIATTCNQRKYYAAQDHTYDARLRLLSSFHNADT